MADVEFVLGATRREQAVHRALDLLMRRAAIRLFTKRVLVAERALHRLVDERAWRAYLRLEVRVNERDRRVLDGAIRIALREGLKARRRR